MGRVAKYRTNQSAKSAIERKAVQQSTSNKFTGSNNKKDAVRALMDKHTKNSR